MAEKTMHIGRFSFNDTDVVRICVIASLVVSSAIITILAFHLRISFITTQIFYIAIIYAASVYPKRGIIVAGICGVAYECIGFFYNYPDLAALLAVIVQAVLFICVGSIIAYLIGIIKAKEVQYSTVFTNSPLAMVLFDRTTTVIRHCNTKFAGLLHYPPEELSKMTFKALLVNPQEQVRFFEQINSQEETEDFETIFVTREGTACRVNLSWSKADEHTISCTAISMNFNIPEKPETAVDISEYKRLEEKIRLDNTLRRGIIITVAHELRTPLQPIMGFLTLLIEDPQGFGLTDETQIILKKCLTSVDRERQIINKMLDLSELESGRLTLKYLIFPPRKLVESVIEENGYATKSEIILNIPETITIYADMERLFVVIDSLLSNAINYSKPPRRIAISYYSGESDPYHHLSMEDNGIGIPESAFASIFEPFQLADATLLSRKYNRIGLSLAVAQKIMELHGGNITVKSTVNAGSTFTIQIPKEVPHDT